MHTQTYRPTNNRPDDVFPFWSLKLSKTNKHKIFKKGRGEAREKGKKKKQTQTQNKQNKATKT